MKERNASRETTIVGAGMHGRVVSDVCATLGRPVKGFLDDAKPVNCTIGGAPVVGSLDRLADSSLIQGSSWFVAIGDNDVRLRICRDIVSKGGELTSIIHPSVIIAESAKIGIGVFMGAYARILPDAVLGDCTLVEGYASIGTDGRVGEGSFLGPGVIMVGGSKVGRESFIGAGAVILASAPIGDRAVVGAGSVATRPVPDGGTALGNPARLRTPSDPQSTG